ncbi:vacuolar ATPase assembly integral membrane protein vma21 [Coemansia nantahalensis]|uniref:Vacuolar ATPase assembly integral membrane protein vma21 n=2 Tax=Coemansia TaxID=4863 RepID=A0ACC1L3S3_9FUNG|nr:vacuolar ATPase assembly integral membrane protein vma21 [Coemansia nantahalensis]KAJ2799914.1 vacuolar ATPase assembly integral membrane protein vma21 [Coemansia helicoidea]
MPRARKSAQAKQPRADGADHAAREASPPRPRLGPREEATGAPRRAQIPGSVVGKLVAFSLLLLVAPILVYFASLNLVFSGSTTPAAIAAAVTANIVLAAYVYAAWIEDQEGGGVPAQKQKTG